MRKLPVGNLYRHLTKGLGLTRGLLRNNKKRHDKNYIYNFLITMGRKPKAVKKENHDKSRKKKGTYLTLYEDQVSDLTLIADTLNNKRPEGALEIGKASLMRDAADKVIIDHAHLLEYVPVAVKKQKEKP